MRAGYLLPLMLLLSWWVVPTETYQVEEENIPSEILDVVDAGPFSDSYTLDGSINPFYLRGDFDGDGHADYALRVKSKTHAEAGIAVWLSSQNKILVLGAGTPFRVSGQRATNLVFLNIWRVFPKGAVGQGVDEGAPPRLIGEAILAGKRESGSGLIYWNGKAFEWYQQGD